MEKEWENFWTSGKVEDYLSYKNSTSKTEKEERNTHGTDGGSNGNGAFRHADF